MKKPLREVIIPERKGQLTDEQIKYALGKKPKKRDYRDYYREIGKPYHNIKWREIRFSKATEKKLKAIAKKWNASINYVIIKIITEMLDSLKKDRETGSGDLILEIVSGDAKRNLKNSREF